MIPWFKIGAVLTSVLLAWLGWQHYLGLLEENEQLTIDLRDARVELAAVKAEQQAMRSRVSKLDWELAQARASRERLRGLFAGHDFTRLAKKKPGLITKRMQNATEAKFRELEELTRE